MGNYIDSVDWFKVIYIFSSLVTVLGFTAMAWSYLTGHLLDLLLIIPVFTVFYPIALLGTIAYTLKKAVKEISISKLLQLTGDSSGIESLMDFGTQGENINE